MCNFYVSCWQVNGIPLIGETHKEVVSILKELPVHVYLVCARIIPPSVPNSDEEDDDDVCLSLKELLAGFNDKVGTAWRGGKLRGVDLILKSFSLKTAWITVDQHVKRNITDVLYCCKSFYIFCSLSLLSVCSSWTRVVSFPVLQLRTSPSVACPPCHLLWPCGRERLRWSSWRKESRAWASVSWTIRSETCLWAFLQIEPAVIGCSLRISVFEFLSEY